MKLVYPIELLVVVAILGILASVGLGYFTAQKRGRDTQRKESLASIAGVKCIIMITSNIL